MHTVGFIIALFAGIFTFASALALAFSRNEDGETSAFQWIDVFLIGGIISFFLGLARGISDGFHKRSSSSFTLSVVFFTSLATLVLGLWMTS